MEENRENSEKNREITENKYQEKPGGFFKKGNPGRPVGAKNKPKFIDELEEMLDEIAEGKDYTYRKALKKQILKKMIIDGDTALLREYWQQRDGKPRSQVELTGKDGKDLIPQPILGGQTNEVSIDNSDE